MLLSAISKAPSNVLQPPMKPALCTNFAPAMPLLPSS